MEIVIKKDEIKTSPSGNSYVITIPDELKKEIAKTTINEFLDSPEFMRVLTIAMERRRDLENEWYEENDRLLYAILHFSDPNNIGAKHLGETLERWRKEIGRIFRKLGKDKETDD